MQEAIAATIRAEFMLRQRLEDARIIRCQPPGGNMIAFGPSSDALTPKADIRLMSAFASSSAPNKFAEERAQNLQLLFDDFGLILHGSKQRQVAQMPL